MFLLQHVVIVFPHFEFGYEHACIPMPLNLKDILLSCHIAFANPRRIIATFHCQDVVTLMNYLYIHFTHSESSFLQRSHRSFSIVMAFHLSRSNKFSPPFVIGLHMLFQAMRLFLLGEAPPVHIKVMQIPLIFLSTVLGIGKH